jgi:predicted nucleic acid-binding protein
MAEALFVDTGFIIAVLSTRDRHHEIAMEWLEKVDQERTPLVISSAVILELGDGFRHTGHWADFEAFIQGLCAAESTTVVEVGLDILWRAVALRSKRHDKEWGLTDCTSFVIMHDRAITSALACDRHFHQAGFRALLIE